MQTDAMEWTREDLTSEGFVRFADLPSSPAPRPPGVYVVLREHDRDPEFLDASPAGRFKGKDRSVEESHLRDAWVPGSRVVYIGKASGGASGTRGIATPASAAVPQTASTETGWDFGSSCIDESMDGGSGPAGRHHFEVSPASPSGVSRPRPAASARLRRCFVS